MKPVLRFPTATFRATTAAALLTLTSFAAVAQDTVATPAAIPADKVVSLAETGEPMPVINQTPTAPASSSSARKSREKTDHEKRLELMGISLGFVATVMGIGIAFFAVWVDYRKRREVLTICHQERMAALEKGLELPPFPPEFCQSDVSPKPSVPGTGLKPGLVLVAVGIGLWMFLSPHVWGLFNRSVSAIPGAIGVAYLLYYVFEGRKRSPGKNTPTT